MWLDQWLKCFYMYILKTSLDANNLYGTAQCLPLPKNNFRWATSKELKFLNLFYQKEHEKKKLIETGVFKESDGFFVECDLIYPVEVYLNQSLERLFTLFFQLHELHSDLPLAPISKNIIGESLSRYQKEVLSTFTNVDSYKSTKLVASLEDKKSYCLHYSALSLYLKLGLKLEKIHRW